MRADDIVRQRFTKVFRGYDVQEVDLFLDEVIRTLDELGRERNLLLSRVEALLNELDRYDALLQGAGGDLGALQQAIGQQPVLQPGAAQQTIPVQPVLAAQQDTPAALVQAAPVSGTPVSEIPASEIPASEIPASEISVSEIPVSEIPVPEIPVSEIPASEIPVSEIPVPEILALTGQGEPAARRVRVSPRRLHRARGAAVPIHQPQQLLEVSEEPELVYPTGEEVELEGTMMEEYPVEDMPVGEDTPEQDDEMPISIEDMHIPGHPMGEPPPLYGHPIEEPPFDTADVYPTDAYPTDAYPTDAYPTDAYPTDEYPTDAYPTDVYPTDQE